MAVPTNGNYLDNELTVVGKIHFNTHFTPLLEYSGRIRHTYQKWSHGSTGRKKYWIFT